MARCKNAELLHKIGVNQLKDWMEVTFSLVSDITNCVTINTRDAVGGIGEYRMYDRPINQWDCNGGICTTTGTLYSDEGTEFYKTLSPTEYAAGIITMYVKPDNSPSNTHRVKVDISSDSDFTNADTYLVSIAGMRGGDGYYPVLVDLSKTPTSTSGNGWDHNGSGVYVRVAYGSQSGSTWTDAGYGVSTIEFYKSMYDMATANIVKIACLSEVGGTFDVAALEETCLSSGYDETSLSGGIDQTITGKQLTSNYWMLNPLTGMNRYDFGDDGDVGYRVETVKKVVDAGGTVQICDIFPYECSFIGAQVDDKCVTPAADLLHRVLSPVEVDLEYDQFQVLFDDTYAATFYFNTNLVGKEVLITYPQMVYLKERMVGNNENLGEVHVKMSYPRFLSDGTEEIHTFNNVLITSFPSSINNEETEFSFTVNIQRDSNGDWFTVQRVLSDYSAICPSPGGD